MKKEIFKGNVKREYVSYIWVTIILFAFIGIGVGSISLFSSFQHEAGSFDRNAFLIFSVLCYLFGVIYPLLIIFVIRQYPKYPKIRRLCLNSDYYFTDSDTKDFHGHRRGRATFAIHTKLAEQNAGLENIKYPKKYTLYIILTIIGILLAFANIVGTCFFMENIELLPPILKNEVLIFTVFSILEILIFVMSFLFAFRVKNIRKATIDEYKRNKK